jgi:hypothetical protein
VRRGAGSDQLGGAFGDRDGGGLGVAAHDPRHQRGVDHAQRLEAVDAQPAVDDGALAVPRAQVPTGR